MTEPALRVAGASLRLGTFSLHRLELALAAGEILVILGPNGAGKSVTLELIAGFHRPTEGRVSINGRDVTDLPPERRHVAFVVQDFGLFPHLTVAENVAFGLAEGSTGRRREPVVAALLEQFGIAVLAHRWPGGLSPGEKQRTALARALATRPELFLFDEPFSALDAGSHERLRDDLKRFLRRSGLPAVFVTHDRTDAFALADRLAILQSGVMVQTGPVDEVYRRPATAEIAELIGFDNILPGRVLSWTNGAFQVAVENTVVAVTDLGGCEAGSVVLCIRGEDIALSGAEPNRAAVADATSAVTRLSGRVVEVTNLGPFAKLRLDCGFPLTACAGHREVAALRIIPGSPMTAVIQAAAVHVVS